MLLFALTAAVIFVAERAVSSTLHRMCLKSVTLHRLSHCPPIIMNATSHRAVLARPTFAPCCVLWCLHLAVDHYDARCALGHGGARWLRLQSRSACFTACFHDATENFYQTNRFYITSRSFSQLKRCDTCRIVSILYLASQRRQAERRYLLSAHHRCNASVVLVVMRTLCR